jgi:hypothetical protein
MSTMFTSITYASTTCDTYPSSSIYVPLRSPQSWDDLCRLVRTPGYGIEIQNSMAVCIFLHGVVCCLGLSPFL